MDEMRYCQSCAMPIRDGHALWGTEADGSFSSDYCTHCYRDGKFAFPAAMEDMIHFHIPDMLFGNPGMAYEEARTRMFETFPLLKRWARQDVRREEPEPSV